MSDPAWWMKVCEDMAAYQRDNPVNLPGAAFGALIGDSGPLISSVGNGWTDNTICLLGSMAKPFVAAGVMLALKEFHKLDLTIPVHTVSGMDALGRDDVKRRIQVRHLLQHTSGLPNIARYSDWPNVPCLGSYTNATNLPKGAADLGPTIPWIGSPGITNEYVDRNGECWPARYLLLEDVSDHVMRNYPMVQEPGGAYAYSTANYVVAGRLIEVLSGQSANLYIREKIFKPLGMKDSFFVAGKVNNSAIAARISEGVSQAQRSRIPDVALITSDGKLPEEIAPGPSGRWDNLRDGWNYTFPDSGMYSTVSDLLIFMKMLVDGGIAGGKRVLPDEIVSYQLDDQGFGHTMGFGYRLGHSVHGPNAPTLAYMGLAMTYFWIDPDPRRPLLGVFLSQRLTSTQVNTNVGDGMRAIFNTFVPAVKRGYSPEMAAVPTSMLDLVKPEDVPPFRK